MDELIITKTVRWIHDNVHGRMTKDELAEKASASELPPVAKDAFFALPDGEYTQSEALARIQDDLVGRIGAANMTMRGFGGSS